MSILLNDSMTNASTAIWTVVIFIFGIGLLLDRINSPVPRQGLTA